MSFAMQEPEPLKLKKEFPPRPERDPVHYGTRKDTKNHVGEARF